MSFPIIEMRRFDKPIHIPTSVLYSHQECRCFYCNRYMYYAPHTKNPKGYSIDHLFPRSKGYGKGGNSVLACRPCNEKKADRWPTLIEIVKAWELYQKMSRSFIASVILP